MPLRLEITSFHQRRLNNAGVKEFGVSGGTIGRSLESDWVLQDSKRYVSSRHASIDFRSGSYYIVDTSSNGVYVNGETKPVGKAKPQRLFDGDRLRIGEYEMVAHIVESDSEHAQFSDDRHVDPVDRASLVEQPDLTGHELIGEHEMTGVGIEDLLLEDADASALKQAAIKAAADLRLEVKASDSRRIMKTLPSSCDNGNQQPEKSGNRPDKSPSAALDALFRGAGLLPRNIDEQQVAEILHRLGQLIRELIIGLSDAVHFRAEQKSKLLIPSTLIQQKENNPLTFSGGVDEALNALISEPADEYQNAIDATREAFQDMKIHQQATLDAVHVALSDFIERLDPDELEQSFDHGMTRNAFISAAKKLRYWERYRDIFQAISQHAPGQFPQLFAEELSRSYEEKAAHLKAKQRSAGAARKLVTKLPKSRGQLTG